MPRLFKSFGHELRALFPVWLFFFLAFSLLRLTQSVMLRQFGFHFTTPSLVLVGSLIVAKTFLVIEWFSFVERFKVKPLIYGVIWKSCIYFLGAFIMYILEQLVELTIRHHNPYRAWTELSAALGMPRFWVILVWLLVLLFAYTATRETVRAIGKDRFMTMWFG